MPTQLTKDAKGVKTKINPKNIVYNAPIEEIKKIVPFEVGIATLDKRVKFLIKAAASLIKSSSEDELEQSIVEDAIKALTDSTVAVLDKEYEFKALTGIKQNLEKFFSNRFVSYCGTEEKPKKDKDFDGKYLVELIDVPVEDEPTTCTKSKKPVNTKHLNLLSKEEARTAVEADFTDELKSKKPKVSNTGLANEQCSCQGYGVYGGESDMDLIFEKLYKSSVKKLDRVKNGTKGELIEGTQYWTKPTPKKEGILKLNKKEYAVDIGKFQKYEPVRDAFGRFASKTLMSKKSSNRKKKATGKKVIKSKK